MVVYSQLHYVVDNLWITGRVLDVVVRHNVTCDKLPPGILLRLTAFAAWDVSSYLRPPSPPFSSGPPEFEADTV